MCEIIIESAKDNNNLGAIVKLLDDENLTRAVGLFLPLQRENRVQAIKIFVHQNHVGMGMKEKELLIIMN